MFEISERTTAAQEKPTEWIIPLQITHSGETSVTFIKQLTVIAVGTITFEKQIFPEESYVTETFGGIELKTLKTNYTDESVQFLNTSLRNSFKALESKYLAKLVLSLHEGPTEEGSLVEMYTFEYSYLPVPPASKHVRHSAKYSIDNIRKQTLQLLEDCRKVARSSTLKNRNDLIDITLTAYYNSDAPLGYQVPGFQPLTAEHAESQRLTELEELGWTETPFHRLVLRSSFRELPSSSELSTVPEFSQSDIDMIMSAPD